MRRRRLSTAVFLFVLGGLPTVSLAADLRDRLSPSLVVVAVLDDSGRQTGQGSGVALGAGRVVTNCHVALAGPKLEVRQGRRTYATALQYSDPERDLCQLTVEGFDAPAAGLGDSSALAVGQKVYALGAPKGQEFVQSEGSVTGLRQHENGHYIQISAAIFPGSSGGGLFDEGGRLVGITTFYLQQGKKLYFALPANWIAELPKRAQAGRTGESALVQLSRALALEEDRDWNTLLALAQDWMQSAPADAGFFLGEAHAGLRQYELAAEAYRALLQLQPENADAWYSLGVCYGELKRHEQAVNAYREALRRQPTHVDSWINLGVSYSRAHKFDEAIDAYRQALRLQPKSADIWYNLGVAYYRQGRHDKVWEIEQNLRELDPQLADRYAELLMPAESK